MLTWYSSQMVVTSYGTIPVESCCGQGCTSIHLYILKMDSHTIGTLHETQSRWLLNLWGQQIQHLPVGVWAKIINECVSLSLVFQYNPTQTIHTYHHHPSFWCAEFLLPSSYTCSSKRETLRSVRYHVAILLTHLCFPPSPHHTTNGGSLSSHAPERYHGGNDVRMSEWTDISIVLIVKLVRAPS